MARELIPELHDCLKLTILQHNFSDFDRFLNYAPNTRTWKGVLQHHCKISKEDYEAFPAFPTDKETFLLHIADGMAANFSRHEQGYKGETSFVLHKLWNQDAIADDKRLREDHEIVELLNFYKIDPTFEGFNKKYGYILKSRPEDARTGKNITSLKTHLILTGKFYRFFIKSSTLKIGDHEIIPTVEKVADLRDTKLRNCQIYLARCKFHFNQKPIRARDLNIFEHLENTILQIESEFNDNLLFSSSDEILIYYDDASVLERIRTIATENGLWISVTWVKKPLIEMQKANPSKLNGNISANLYETLPPSISPPICEICQMAPATQVWPLDYLSQFGEDSEVAVEGTEHLCNSCFYIRNRPSKLKKLRKWTEFETANVVWIKFNLDYEVLTDVLQKLYLGYVQKFNPKARKDDAEIRFSLVYEFQQDYDVFLSAFKEKFLESFGDDCIETILKDMFCLKVERMRDIFMILEIFDKTLESIFPELKKIIDGPIRVSITCCNSKFPFFEVWRNIEEQGANLQIFLTGHGKIETSFNYLEQMLTATQDSYRKSALYKLAEISKLSEKLAELKFNDSSEKGDFESYKTLKRNLLPMGMDFGSILTFAKLIED